MAENAGAPLPIWTVLRHALRGRCAQCGQGRLLHSYLKPVDFCAVCRASYSGIRADDGPAWLTILIVGHIVAPFIPGFARGADWPVWAQAVLWSAVALALILAILPRAKAVFIALIWRSRTMKPALSD